MDKIDLLLDAIEHPDRYSETEMAAMLADPEVRDVYDLLSKTKSGLTRIPECDIDAEWDAFKKSHFAEVDKPRRTFRAFNIFSRNIAASIAIGVASLVAVAAVIGVSLKYDLNQKPSTTLDVPVAEKCEKLDSAEMLERVEEIPAVAAETIVFDNEPLESIATHISDYYGYKAEFNEDAPRALRLYFRWNQGETIDEVVESLNNFEQIHISISDKTITVD